MTDEETTYNGWTNRETWLANLWITNEEGTDTDAREVVREAVEDWEPPAALAPYYEDSEMRQNGRFNAAADALEEWASETFVPELEGFVSDLFNGAWGRIDWREVAEGLLEQ